MFSRDEMQRAIEDALKTMEGVALELYRRGREPLLEELEEARARNADMRAMLEQVTRERDEARTSCPDCAMWAERSARWHDDMQRAERERDEARAEAARLRRLLNMAEDELIAADDHGRREANRADTIEAEVEALKAERDEARAEVEHAYREGGALYEAKIAEREAFRRGAEAMREACAVALLADGLVLSRERAANVVRALPTPEEP